MSDNPAQEPIIGPGVLVALAVIATSFEVIFVILHILDAKRHGFDDWPLKAVALAIVPILPWGAFLGGYRQVKKLLLTGETPRVILQAIRFRGAMALCVVSTALLITLIETFLR